MGEVNEPHDPEDEREPRSHQKQHDPGLDSVQHLFNQQDE